MWVPSSPQITKNEIILMIPQVCKNLIKLLVLLFFTGCGFQSQLLSTEDFEKKKALTTETNRLLWMQEIVDATSYPPTITEHYIVSIEKGKFGFAGRFAAVSDGSTSELLDYEIKFIREDGSYRRFFKSDLITVSNKGRENYSSDTKYPPIDDKIDEVVYIEIYKKSKFLLASLGHRFSPVFTDKQTFEANLIVRIPKKEELICEVINTQNQPIVSLSESYKEYIFEFKNISYSPNRFRMSKKNNIPFVLMTFPNGNETVTSWKDFGDQYLELIKKRIPVPDKIKKEAEKVTEGLMTDEEKMNAIFRYCQSNIRYEISYLKFGEFVPNQTEIILDRKYGDCKDYSILIYQMATSVGLSPNLALCYRGVGSEFFEQIPVNQFNHLIVGWNNGNKWLWYDGTNRVGLDGIPTRDLINQLALVVEKENSRLVKIEEHPENRLIVTGELNPNQATLQGKIKIEALYQFANDLTYYSFQSNESENRNFLNRWLKSILNEDATFSNISWSQSGVSFFVEADVVFPTSMIKIGDSFMTTGNRILKDMIPIIPEPSKKELFVYNDYNRYDIHLTINNSDKSEIRAKIDIPFGPYKENEIPTILNLYDEQRSLLNQTITFQPTKE